MNPSTSPLVVLAVAAHPDDIEFSMAGTLLRLKQSGADIHLWNLANGGLGSVRLSREATAALRWQETLASSRLAGATAHPPVFDDLAIFYDAPSLAVVTAGIRQIRPNIILTHPLRDYMEDHQVTARLVGTAAIARGMGNYPTQPPTEPFRHPVALYHAMPHGLRNPEGDWPRVTHFVDVEPVFATKRDMLAQHASQREWLDVSQGMDAYLAALEQTASAVGERSGRFRLAEAFTQHAAAGLAAEGHDPLAELLGTSAVQLGA